MDIELDMIRTDGGTQPRVQLDLFTVAEYADAMENGAQFPPVMLFFDGTDHWLADGYHRIAAAQRIGRATIAAEIRPGTQRDAVLYSVGANASHGLRRTNADKRQAVMTLLNDPEWAKWSDGEIARHCRVSQPFVSGLRKSSLITVMSEERVYTDRWGNINTMNTENIGRVVINTNGNGHEDQTPPTPTLSLAVDRPTIPMVADHAARAPDQERQRAQLPARYPLAIVLGRAMWEKWQQFKIAIDAANDTAAFEKLLKEHGNGVTG